MTTIFGGSRLANLRQKRTSGDEGVFKKQESMKLTLPQDETEKSSYEPSSTGTLSRTQTRLLKGRIERPAHEKQDLRISNENFYQPNSSASSWSRQPSNTNTEQLKLVINDDPPKDDRKNSVESNPMRTTQKRILIAKQPEKEPVESRPLEQIKTQTLPQTLESEPQKPIIFNQEKPIKEQEIEESMQCENDLVECPEGCGRKFNRKALEKHAKACKLVFMSKRKEFNSEAKRLVNKEQAIILKQQKEKQKKDVKGKTKGFQKTSDNWKAASENFRAVVKAIKKETGEQEENKGEDEQEEMKIIICKFCEKPFAEVFIEKHSEVCGKKKQAEKKKTLKKK